MDLKLKNIRHATLMSDETNAFTATQEVSPLRCPDSIRCYSMDEVAETIPGLTLETFTELWDLLSVAENPKPLGGDGSNGTIEEPIISSGEYGSDIVAGWPKLSRKSQENIIGSVKLTQNNEVK